MNTFLETKLGEVLAFARVGTDTLEKGASGFANILEPQNMDVLSKGFVDLEQKVVAFATQEEVLDEVEKSAKETNEKVTSMRDTYIDGAWDESSEVLEWMGFYTGASLVHWYLVNGAASSLALTELKDMSDHAIKMYSSLFSADEKFLQNIGAKDAE